MKQFEAGVTPWDYLLRCLAAVASCWCVCGVIHWRTCWLHPLPLILRISSLSDLNYSTPLDTLDAAGRTHKLANNPDHCQSHAGVWKKRLRRTFQSRTGLKRLWVCCPAHAQESKSVCAGPRVGMCDRQANARLNAHVCRWTKK